MLTTNFRGLYKVSSAGDPGFDDSYPASCKEFLSLVLRARTSSYAELTCYSSCFLDIDDEVNLVAFHININEEFYGLEHGHFAQDILKKREGRWMYFIPDFKVKQGDTIYYWIYVIVDKLGYHGLDRVYKVARKYF